MSTPGDAKRRRAAAYRKGQSDLAAELLPFFVEIGDARRLPVDFWPRVMEIRSRLLDLARPKEEPLPPHKTTFDPQTGEMI